MTDNAHDIDLNGLELLIVEDDAASALLISRVLSRQGARVEIAVSGDDGLRKFQEHHFPIVITDINMPGMSGIELASRIRALDLDTRIIATSANQETDCLVSAIGLGFSEYLIKPVEFKNLLRAVARCYEIITVKRQLDGERRKFKAVVDCLGEGLTIKDLEYRILYQNKAMTEMFGDYTGSGCFEVFGLSDPCQDCPTVEAFLDGRSHTACRDYQIQGETRHIESTASLLRDGNGTVTGSVEIIRDISQRIKNEQTIRDMAFHDPLTGLSNRRLFEDRLEQTIAKSRRYGMQFGLLTLDLDHFKEVNDTHGHDAGDLVLVEAAERIRFCCRRDLDTICRQGGDEFCIIITDSVGKEHLTGIAEKLLQQFTRPFQIGDSQTQVTTSIGISIFPDNGTEMKELEIASDRAMYAAKKAGRNTYFIWEPDMVH